jgi:uncharacterized protein (UPF0218 family)
MASALKKQVKRLHPTMISTVGDEVTRLCNQVGITPNLAIIDYKVARKKIYQSLADLGFRTHFKTRKTGDASGGPPARTQGIGPEYEMGVTSGRTRLGGNTKEGFEIGFRRLSKEACRYQTVKNPPGHITKTLVAAVKKAVKIYLNTNSPQIIRVLGEEDLAGVPAILFSPLGSVVLYGQPEEGIVLVEVTKEKKKNLLSLLHHLR